MSNNPETKAIPPSYEIRVEGCLPSGWTDWFEGLSVRPAENGTTLLTGSVPDQAALYGLLKKVRDLGMPLISVQRVSFPQTQPRCSKKEKK